MKIRQVAEELGVRYVLEGSVRRAGAQVRVNAQLIDATTGGHVWAERYDGLLDDVFSIQDSITASIVTALAVTLTGQEEESRAQVETKNSKAYDSFLQGWEHYRLHTADDYVEAVSHFEKAIERDSSYSRAYSALAAVYWNSAWSGWTRNLGISYAESLKRSKIYLVEALKNPSPLTYQISSEISAWENRPEEAVAHAERAIALNPNDAAGYYALTNALIYAKRPEEAVKAIKRAMRLDPHYPATYLTRLGRAQFAMNRFEEAAETLERAAERNPNDEWSFIFLAGAYGHLEREQDAYAAIEKFNTLRAQMGWAPLTLKSLNHWRFKERALRDSLREGLRKAQLSPGDSTVKITHDLSGFSIEKTTTIDATTAKELFDRGVPFIDVRSDKSWADGHIQSATHIKLGDDFFEANLSALLGKDDEVVFYSRGPMCGLAPNASAYAVGWGYSKVYYLRDGFPGWKTEEFPTEP